MELTVKKEELNKKLSLLQGVIDASCAMPILSYVLLKADKDGVTLYATDLTTSVTESLDADMKEEGKFCVLGKKLAEVVREIKGDITLSFKNNKLEIQAANSKYRLNCLDSADFPAWPEIKNPVTFNIPAKSLGNIIRKTIYSVGDSDSRYTLNGMLFHIKDRAINVVATDGHRLALASEELKDPLSELKVILPAKSLNELKKFLEGDGDVTVSLGANHTAFKIGDVAFVTRHIEGNFPDYKNVVPLNGGGGITVNREELLSKVRSVSIINKETHLLRFDISNKSIKLTASNRDIGDATDLIDCEYQGKDMAVGFNAKFLMDALKATDGDEVSISIHDPFLPVLIYTTGDGDKHKNVVMPMKAV